MILVDSESQVMLERKKMDTHWEKGMMSGINNMDVRLSRSVLGRVILFVSRSIMRGARDADR
jgi:hypothetical protein